MKKLHVLLLFLIPGFYFAQSKIKITADYDAAIGYHDNYGTNNKNYKKAIQNAAYVLPGNLGGLNVNRSLIHFDLSQLPKNAIIKSVKLNLYALGHDGGVPGHSGNNNNAIISRVIENWNDSTVTWDNQPKISTKNQVNLAQSNSYDEDYLNIDVTNLFNDIKDSLNFGIKIQLYKEVLNNALFFASIDNGNSQKIPSLDIEYFEGCYTTVTAKDAAIGYHENYNTQDNNYRTAIQNAAYSLNDSQNNLNVNRALIYFDLSKLPKGAQITNATIDLYALGPINGLPGHFGSNNESFIERIIENWNDSTVTWNNQPKSIDSNRVLLPNSVSPTQNYLNINITDLIKNINLNNNFGLKLRLKDEQPSNGLLFCSSENGDINKSPKLNICYTVGNDTSNCNIPQANLIYSSTKICKGEKLKISTIENKEFIYNWYKDGKTISNELNSSILINEGGNYLVVIKNKNCTSTSNSVTFTIAETPNVQIDKINNLFISDSSINLSAIPQGGIFEGLGVENNKFYPSKSKLGKNTISYNIIDINGCKAKSVINFIVSDTLGCNKFDTTKVTIYDTIGNMHKDTLIINFKLTLANQKYISSEIKIYPNPTSEYIIIESKDFSLLTNFTIELKDLDGRSLYMDKIKSSTNLIPLDKIVTKGTYIINILDVNSTVIETKKIILQ